MRGIGETLAHEVASLRAELGDAWAPIVVVVPSIANAALLRRALAERGPFFAVWFETPEQILAGLPPLLASTTTETEKQQPAGWLRPTVGRALDALVDVDAKAKRFQRPGWRDPLVKALQKLEDEGVTSASFAAASSADVDEHARVLSFLLRFVEDARAAEGFAAPSSRFHVDVGGAAVGGAAASAVLVVGDRTLPRVVFTPFCKWLRARRRRRVRLPVTSQLPLLPQGLQEAAGVKDADAIDVAAAPAPAIVRTPDDVREAVEVVRLVQRAVVEGTPLDRIAVVVPDAQGTAPLARAFARAEIPATFLVARPWRALPIAGWVQLVVDVVAGDESAFSIAALLRHPCTSLVGLGATGDANVVVGRARFRTLLGRCRDARGAARIAALLEENASEDMQRVDELGPPNPPMGGGGPARIDAASWRKQARTNLILLLRRLDDVVTQLRVERALGEHAAALLALMKTAAKRSQARARLAQALSSLLGAGGPPLTPAQLAEEVAVVLDGAAPLEPLVDAAVRVLAPLQIAGGSFDVVIACSVVDGRLPTPPREDPVLPDRLLRALDLDALITSTFHEVRERWRYAALAGAAKKTLLVSVPALELASNRPTTPSPFIAAQRQQKQTRLGSRAWPWRDDVDQPLGVGERRARTGSLDEHGVAVLALERALRQGVVEELPSDLVLPSTLTAEAFVELCGDPLTFFFRRVLNAWPAASLHANRSLLEPKGLARALQRALDDAPAGATAADVGKTLQRVLDDAVKAGAQLDGGDVAEAVALSTSLAAAVLEREPDAFANARVDVTKPLGPFAITTTQGRVVAAEEGRAMVRVVSEVPAGLSTRLSAFHVGLALCDDDVREARVFPPGERGTTIAREKAQAFVDEAVAVASAVHATRKFVCGDDGSRFSFDAERDRVTKQRKEEQKQQKPGSSPPESSKPELVDD